MLKNSRGTLVALALGFVLGAPSVATAADAIGAERCGACHQKEYEDWKKTPHARALARLSTTKQRDPVCRSCHTMEPTSDDRALAGVQCESCHGKGSLYSPRYVMKDDKLRVLLGLEKVEEGTCRSCHDSESPSAKPFDYATLLQLVNHSGKPAGEGS